MEPEGSFAAFTSARHLSLSWTNSIQSMLPHPTSWKSILILSSHLSLSLLSGLYPTRFPIKPLYKPLLSPPIHATCPAFLIPVDLITRTTLGEEYGSLSSSLSSFLHPLYSPQHPVLKHPQPSFFLKFERPNFTPVHNITVSRTIITIIMALMIMTIMMIIIIIIIIIIIMQK